MASCSPTDLNIIIWDVSREEGVPLKRVGGGGICFTRWSSDGSRLFAASYRNVFRYIYNKSFVNLNDLFLNSSSGILKISGCMIKKINILF